MKKLNLVGETFGLLTVIKKGSGCVSPNGTKKTTWICKCSCGNTKEVIGGNLKSGTSKSCGCVRIKKNIERSTKHNKSKRGAVTKEYRCWIEIKRRCFTPSCKAYTNYGGRGITVCDEWKDNFRAFYDYIGPAPSPSHSIDRIDVDGDYEPGNVRWATKAVQNINKRLQERNLAGCTGVSWSKQQNKWTAYIGVNNKHICLGSFDNVEDAINARLKAEEKYHKPILNS